MNYVCVSGGADSTALDLLLWERGEEFEMLFSETGAELPENYWILPRLAQQVGKPLNVVVGGTFLQGLTSQGYLLPAPSIRWCTRMLKQQPQDRFLHGVHASRVFVGIRADEPNRAVDRKPREGDHRFEYPLFDAGLDKAAVKSLCEKYDLLNPVYTWRSSVSCFCCFFQRKYDWLGLLKNHPDLFRVAEEWEGQSIRTTRGGWTWNKSFRLHDMRSVDEKQLALWPEPEGEPCVICRV